MNNPRTEAERLDQTTVRIAESFKGLVTLVRSSEELQWLRSTSSAAGTDPGVRQRGGHSDPTGDAAVDARRLSIRHQRKRSIGELEKMAATLETLHGDLQRAVDRWSQ